MRDQQHRSAPLPAEQHLLAPPPIEVPPPEPLVVRGTIRVDLQFEADVSRLASRFPTEYAAHPIEAGFADWERGATFLDELIRDRLDAELVETEGLKDVSYWDPEIKFDWSLDQAKQLDASLGIERQ